MNAEQTPESLFHAARAISDPRERGAFLERACADDALLRGRIERLLRADARAEGFLEAAGESESVLGLEQPGERIDRYRLLELIGEGGFGSVWMAEQTEPVKRRAALKIIKLGMDTKSVVARFEAERQALALMDHPSIAKVFDGGATATGRPYFVMELVKGIPITSFCDETRQPLRARLELFVQVCAALQHAHHKGVIHRDVKPSNVLVTVQDGRALPKVIDFGIAKATGVELTEKTLFTGFHQMIGTPEYMAPEQAAMSGLDIDTRADVYSLGVLLYELLTGCKPFDLRTAMNEGYAAVVRTIREKEPVKPSTRASTADETSERAALLRSLRPRDLSSRLRGDLDWIVLKALEKDRARRYDTASALADDIERYLRDEPVLATPPSARYQLAKYVRRNKGLVTAAAVVLLVLLGGIAASTTFAMRAETRRSEADRERGQADIARNNAERSAERASTAERQTQQRAEELAQVVAFQERQIAEIDAESVGLRIRTSMIEQRRANAARGDAAPDEVAAEVAKLERELRGANLTTLAVDALDESIFEPTRRAIDEQFATQPLVRAGLLARLAQSLENLGRFEHAASIRGEVVTLRERELGPEHELTLEARLELLTGSAPVASLERVAQLETIASESRRLFGPDHDLELSSLAALAKLNADAGRHEQSEQQLRNALEGWRRRGLEDDERALDARASLGSELINLERVEEGAVELEAALAGNRRVFGPRDRRALPVINSVCTAWMRLGRQDQALAELRDALEIARQIYGDDHTVTLGLLNNLAGNLLNVGRTDEAEPLFVELVERLRRVPGVGDVELYHALARFGRLRSAQRRYEEAIPLLSDGYEGLDRQLPPESPVVSSCAHNLGTALCNVRRFQEAEPILRRAYDARRATLGDEHVDTATTAQALASTLHGLQRVDEAFEIYRPAVDVLERAFGPDHDRVVRAWRNLGVIAIARRDFTSGATAFTRCSEALRRIGALDGPDLHSDLALLATCLLELGRWSDAEAAMLECRAIRERILPPEHWGHAHASSLLGAAVLAAGRFEEARALLEPSADSLLTNPDLPAPTRTADRAAEAAERVIQLFEAWSAADTSQDFAATLATWRQRLADRRALIK